MNRLIALGIGLTDVIRMVTINAASMLGLTDELGSLAPGRVADVSILAVDEDDWTCSRTWACASRPTSV